MSNFIKINTIDSSYIQNNIITINIDDISTIYEFKRHGSHNLETHIIMKGRDCENDDILFKTYTPLEIILKIIDKNECIFDLTNIDNTKEKE